MKRILCIWLPNWPVQQLVVEQPELRNRPVVLHAQYRGRGHRVVACSSSARACGIRPDMPLAEAKSVGRIANPSHSMHLQLHDPNADRAALEKLAHWCEQFSPLVGLEEADHPQSLLLDVSGMEFVFGDEPTLAHTVGQNFHQHGYATCIAIADTVGAAWAAAHFGSPIADCESNVIVPHRMNRVALGPLPIQALRLADTTLERLHQLGIFQIEQLMGLPRASLPSRFGSELVQRLDQVLGIAEEVITPHRPLPELATEFLFEYPTTDRRTIEQVLSQLVDQMAGQLAERNQGVIQLECKLICEGMKKMKKGSGPICAKHPAGRSGKLDLTPFSFRVGLFQPTAAPAHLMELVRMQLDRLTIPAAVNRVHVAVVTSAPLQRHQFQLFDNSMHERPRQLAHFVNRLSSRLGQACVVQPRPQAGALPEQAYRYQPLTGHRFHRKQTEPQKTKQLADPLQRPLQLQSPPVSLHVVSIADGGGPAMFHYQNQNHRIARWWGPERIETEWWRGKLVRRDYYRVETTAGARFWLFRRLQDQQWFLHGEFE